MVISIILELILRMEIVFKEIFSWKNLGNVSLTQKVAVGIKMMRVSGVLLVASKTVMFFLYLWGRKSLLNRTIYTGSNAQQSSMSRNGVLQMAVENAGAILKYWVT